MDQGEIRLGVIGCGGFGLYALQQFAQVPGVKLAGMAGTHREAAHAAALRFGIPDIEDVGKMLERDDIDLVYIATPPFLHHPQAMQALRAGKHVICEKPLAMTVAQADEMIAEAQQRDRLLVANLMQRYNPVSDAVGRLVRPGCWESCCTAPSRIMPPTRTSGPATGSGTGPRAEASSSSMACISSTSSPAGWAPAGSCRPSRGCGRASSPPIEEHVHCTVRYGQSMLVSFYHGFHQTGRMDRQELRLVFERGDVTLYDWVPTRVRVHAIADEAQTRSPLRALPRRQARCHGDLRTEGPSLRGPAQDPGRLPDAGAVLGRGDQTSRTATASCSVRSLADQLAWVRDHSHPGESPSSNGRDSLAVACAADQMARA